jgi:hypothetical protein
MTVISIFLLLKIKLYIRCQNMLQYFNKIYPEFLRNLEIINQFVTSN